MEIVVAMSKNNVIGQDGKMPWHLPADLIHFKNLTSNHAIVMGRKTWESIGRPLPNRLNIVVTKQPDYEASDAVVVHSLAEGVEVAGSRRVFVIGGGQIYSQALPLASRLHLTRIEAMIEGDTHFPDLDETIWTCQSRTTRPADEKNPHSLSFETWTRNQ
ncbi:MAG: dihydrofolate reductase [Phycisphaerales bacterium]|jgi:dihydrofolate reductase|nr:dihydrofolate reductase [Phycisphaerales bacterium]MDP6693421.1 dihydrofolate reductase [Phycisphaerales bacterium]